MKEHDRGTVKYIPILVHTYIYIYMCTVLYVVITHVNITVYTIYLYGYIHI
jgi:hypothetical protein